MHKIITLMPRFVGVYPDTLVDCLSPSLSAYVSSCCGGGETRGHVKTAGPRAEGEVCLTGSKPTKLYN